MAAGLDRGSPEPQVALHVRQRDQLSTVCLGARLSNRSALVLAVLALVVEGGLVERCWAGAALELVQRYL